MTSVLLIYPFFKPRRDNSQFRFPPLGLGYIAASLRGAGHEVSLLDCTFLGREEAVARAAATRAEVVGVYSMITLREQSLSFARALRDRAGLLVAGGPLPSTDPGLFLSDFDVVVRGEGERTMCDLIAAFEERRGFAGVPGVSYRTSGARGEPIDSWHSSGPGALASDLDAIPFPARDLFPNDRYLAHGRRKYGYAITSLMSSRGCPFSCEFCSNAVFGSGCRERSPSNVIDEVEDALSYGYDRIHFGDDVFTLRKERILAVCDEILRRGLRFSWECLGRVDSIDGETARAMRSAGCSRMFFGIESGSGRILRLMNKRITTTRAREALEAARAAGIATGAFFILFYPGDTDDSVLETIRFAVSLPLDYLSFSLPYPIPGTALHERVKDRSVGDWRQPHGLIFDHCRIFDADFSETKMKFGLVKGTIEHRLRRRHSAASSLALRLIERPSDLILRLLK
ncbi:MAG: B12-binding domain-containing radical SAM protein [Rectinemataceae bacterium]